MTVELLVGTSTAVDVWDSTSFWSTSFPFNEIGRYARCIIYNVRRAGRYRTRAATESGSHACRLSPLSGDGHSWPKAVCSDPRVIASRGTLVVVRCPRRADRPLDAVAVGKLSDVTASPAVNRAEVPLEDKRWGRCRRSVVAVIVDVVVLVPPGFRPTPEEFGHWTCNCRHPVDRVGVRRWTPALAVVSDDNWAAD
jgi:hypothetical protein